MNANEQYLLVQYIISKNQDGYLTPDEFNLTANSAQDGFLSFLLGSLNTYQYQRPIARVELGNSEQLLQKLSPFLPPPSTISVDSTGFSPYPTDFIQVEAMWTSATTMQRIKFVQQDSFYSYINSVIDPIATSPIYGIEDKGFRFYPNNIGSALISFLRNPKRIKWAFTPDGQGRPQYDSANSQAPEWNDIDMMEVISRQLAMNGVNLQAGQVMQYAQQIKMQGQ